jgi:hypothetical protein
MVGKKAKDFDRKTPVPQSPRRAVELVTIHGNGETLAALEKNIFDSIGIRVVIRMGSTLEVFSDIEKYLSDTLSLNHNVGEFRALLRAMLKTTMHIGKRGQVLSNHDIVMGDIVVIRPDGREATGQMLLKNAVWEKK